MFLRIRRIQLPWLFFVKADTKRYKNALAKASEANFESWGKFQTSPFLGKISKT